MYSDADIYLLDDPLSALDASVAKDLFEKGVRDFLSGKTCILVTNQVVVFVFFFFFGFVCVCVCVRVLKR